MIAPHPPTPRVRQVALVAADLATAGRYLIRSITVAVDDPERTCARVRWIEGTGGIVEVHLALGRSGEARGGSVGVVAS